MILKCLFLTCFTVLVSTNVGSQIIPAQTYPMYQQNGFLNPSFNPRDPYYQRNTVQNPSAAVNLSPSDITQLLLNRILSDPSLQANVDPNVNSYGTNWYVNPNNRITPNAVNNYLPVPTEQMKNGTPGLSIESKILENESEKNSRRKHKKKSSKLKKKQDGEIEEQNSAKKEIKSEKEDFQSKDTSKTGKKKSKKHSHKQNKETTADDASKSVKNNENESTTKKTKKRKNKLPEEIQNNPVEPESKVENAKPRRRHKKKKSKPNPINDEDSDKEIKVNDKAQKVLKEDIDVANLNQEMAEENRVTRNLLQASKDIVQPYPKISENIPANIFQNLPFDNNNPLMPNYFANFKNIYQPLANKMNVNEKKDVRRRKPMRARKNHKRKNVNQKNSNSVSTTTSNSTQITTEKAIYIETIIPPKIELKPETEVLKLPEEPVETDLKRIEVPNSDFKEEYYETLHENINNENLYESYIDDYYPQFMDNAAYNANHREFYIKNIGNNKYYYAADNIDTHTLNNLKHQEYSLPEHIIKEYEKNKQYYEIENERNSSKSDLKPTIDEVIEFRPPPGLEMPDFQTRKVERTEINRDYYTYSTLPPDKFSTYSETKTSYTGDKINDIKNQRKEKLQKDVETVFAKSKVVKYGHVYNSEEDDDDEDKDSAGSSNHNIILEKNDVIRDGDTIYVVAKSLDFPDY